MGYGAPPRRGLRGGGFLMARARPIPRATDSRGDRAVRPVLHLSMPAAATGFFPSLLSVATGSRGYTCTNKYARTRELTRANTMGVKAPSLKEYLLRQNRMFR